MIPKYILSRKKKKKNVGLHMNICEATDGIFSEDYSNLVTQL